MKHAIQLQENASFQNAPMMQTALQDLNAKIINALLKKLSASKIQIALQENTAIMEYARLLRLSSLLLLLEEPDAFQTSNALNGAIAL